MRKEVEKKLKLVEETTAMLIADRIAGLDKEVFSENPIKRIIILRMRPPSEAKRIAYIPEEGAVSNEPEHYVIHNYGLKKIIDQECRKRVILLSESERSKDFIKMTLEEVFIGIAAHEVRHRVQHLLPIEWISPEHARTIDDPYFRRLIEFRRIIFTSHPPEGNYQREFDAKVIENLVVEKWHYGERNHSRIAELIRLEPKHLAKAEE
jgi:hypothetical protein